jgi:glycosyltransferase involved in cell wall biosynthesis
MAKGFSAARKVFFVSRNNLELFERQIGAALPEAVVVRNPFNVPADQPVPWPADTGIWRLACVARLEPSAKGQDLLLQTLARPQWSARPIEVNFYGSGPAAHGLQRLARHLQLKTVRFRGHVDDVSAIWAENHLLVLPSRFEGLPLALVEAMWCGRPAVVTDIGGATELCVHGETGFVAAAPVAPLIEETMELAWKRRAEWSLMGAAARARVEQIFPRDPIAPFAQQLIACAKEQPAADASRVRAGMPDPILNAPLTKHSKPCR